MSFFATVEFHTVVLGEVQAEAGAHPRCIYPYAENWEVREEQIARLEHR